jgi:DNA-binding XRE family transcriptional regulator
MKTYRPPKRPAVIKPTGWSEPGPPRDFAEWKALRRWKKLPDAERNIPGYLLRLMREKAKLTQAALALRLGITQQAIAHAERWTSNPTLLFLSQWTRACGADFDLERTFPSLNE